MSEELRTAVETDYVSDAYMDYISSENYYD